ncbi:MAG: hypothetical protein PHV75_01575 [Victivallaceae bacterium]|nr:hypothetical protein [Victivallaceae bacterium]MDD3117291.1 hypothetical protein [Victivallaceae bacterium]MDD3703331.1 hypothetical protein [Victivallaceae bacterium]MDD4317186.1 hypothetical protein [Victivallaceae bacterium]MDD5663277.1 hypothetical protein [Victivallaceae bacterium]
MKKFMLLSAVLCGLNSGCSFLNSGRQVIAVNVQPRDATVVINGLSYPGGSVFAEVPRNREVLIEAWHEKYITEKYVVPIKMSTSGILDACGSIFVLPAIGLFMPGAWELKENVVHLELFPGPVTQKVAGATNTVTEKDVQNAADETDNNDKVETAE